MTGPRLPHPVLQVRLPAARALTDQVHISESEQMDLFQMTITRQSVSGVIIPHHHPVTGTLSPFKMLQQLLQYNLVSGVEMQLHGNGEVLYLQMQVRLLLQMPGTIMFTPTTEQPAASILMGLRWETQALLHRLVCHQKAILVAIITGNTLLVILMNHVSQSVPNLPVGY